MARLGTSIEDFSPSLAEQYAAFVRNRFLAMPIAGTIAWAGIGMAGAVLPDRQAAFATFIGTGVIFYIGLAVARLTGEDLLGRKKTSAFFDRVFFMAIMMAVLVYAIAIPFFFVDPSSVALSVGILTGLMWMPFSALIQHWVGYFHALARTVLIVVVWYCFPDRRFVAVPLVIVAVYLVTIYVLEQRVRAVNATTAVALAALLAAPAWLQG
jgi:hypothetical protein